MEIHTFEDDCREAVSGFRAALIALYDSLGSDPSDPQEVARQLGVNKTLTWTLAKVVEGGTGLAIAAQVPGSSSMDRLLKAARRRGASAAAVDGVKRALEGFDGMVEEHVGDRAGLGLLIDSMGEGQGDSLELSRKLAHRGNSGVFGIQARVRLMCWLVAPSGGDPDRIDMAMLSGYVGLRRLRSSVRWPLFKLRHWGENEPVVTQPWKPIDPEGGSPTDPALLTAFTRGAAPEIATLRTEAGVDCILQPGPVGNVGASDFYRGEVLRKAAPRFAATPGETGEFGATITTPSEHLVFDLIAHRELGFVFESETLVFARVYAHGEPTGATDSAARLPMHLQPVELVGSPPAAATALVPGYRELLAHVTERLGWNASEFVGTRLHLKFPPLGATVVQRFALPERG